MFEMLGKISDSFELPILISQHMPRTFTAILAEHIGKVALRQYAEAVVGEQVLSRRIYVARGDFHMLVVAANGRNVIRLTKTPPENFCRPSVDPMLKSMAGILWQSGAGGDFDRHGP